MSNMKSKFIKEYQRQSKSPWDDKSTVLLLANCHYDDSGNMTLDFDSYIYQHRDSCGRILGLSISKALFEKHPEFESRYIAGLDIDLIMLIYKDQICEFCEHFEDEFISLFGLSPASYFEAAEIRWIENIERE